MQIQECYYVIRETECSRNPATMYQNNTFEFASSNLDRTFGNLKLELIRKLHLTVTWRYCFNLNTHSVRTDSSFSSGRERDTHTYTQSHTHRVRDYSATALHPLSYQPNCMRDGQPVVKYNIGQHSVLMTSICIRFWNSVLCVTLTTLVK